MGVHGASVLVHQTSAQSIPNNTYTALTWGVAPVQTGGVTWWSSGNSNRIVIPWDGLYLFTAHVRYAGAANTRYLHIQPGTTLVDANVIRAASVNFSGTANPGRVISYDGVANLSAGSHLIVTTHGNGASLDTEVPSSGLSAWASFVYLGT